MGGGQADGRARNGCWRSHRPRVGWSRRAHSPRTCAASFSLRVVKPRQKISEGLRAMTGAQTFCAIRSYLSTTPNRAWAPSPCWPFSTTDKLGELKPATSHVE